MKADHISYCNLPFTSDCHFPTTGEFKKEATYNKKLTSLQISPILYLTNFGIAPVFNTDLQSTYNRIKPACKSIVEKKR